MTCRSLDEQVARPEDPELIELLQKFVCVRMIQINDLDLSLMQFDFELTWSAFFLNGDRTLYGRYGTRSERDRKRNVFFDKMPEHKLRDGLPKDMSIEGFKASMRSALALHEEYVTEPDRIGPLLRDKRGRAWPWPTPELMPGIRRGCTHCHQVNSNLVLYHRKAPGSLQDRLLWSFPMPDLLGLRIDPDSAADVAVVEPGSEADRAGLRPADVITEIAGQRVVSLADIQWALHVVRDGGEIPIVARRDDRAITTNLALPAGWRRRGSFSWRWRSNRETLKRMLDGEAWHCQDLTPSERAEHGLRAADVGILVLGNLRKNGNVLRTGDVITNVDDGVSVSNCSAFFAYIMQQKPPGSTLRLSILRNGETFDAALSVVE